MSTVPLEAAEKRASSEVRVVPEADQGRTLDAEVIEPIVGSPTVRNPASKNSQSYGRLRTINRAGQHSEALP
jgi:hypothetical protein